MNRFVTSAGVQPHSLSRRYKHLKWTHVDQVQHCTDLSSRSRFQRTLNTEKRGQGWNERWCSSGKLEYGHERDGKRGEKQSTDHRETACCPFAVVESQQAGQSWPMANRDGGPMRVSLPLKNVKCCFQLLC